MLAGMQLPNGLVVGGLSIGGLETCVDLPELRVAIDLGRVPDVAVARADILFTHAHMDHMGGAPWHCATRSLRGLPPPRYAMERCHAEAFGRVMQAWRELDRSAMEHELVLVSPGDEVALAAGRKARCFRSTHLVPTLGWCVLETRRKLKRAFIGASRDTIVRAKEAGEPIHDETEVPIFAHCGDTTIDVLEREELPRRAQVLMLECTFIDESIGVAEARARGHVHLDEISGRPELFDEVGTLVLSHLSPRWSPRAARAILDERLPPALRAKCAYFLP